jgi:hypothetical protein
MQCKMLLPAVSVFMISACAQPVPQQPLPLYHYEDSSLTYCLYKAHMTNESLLNFHNSIERTIERAEQSRSGRVPPGMYANLGYIYLQSGKSKEAITVFKKEKTFYPESTHFMDKMIKKIEGEK